MDSSFVPPSSAQLSLAARLGIALAGNESMGDVSRLIDAAKFVLPDATHLEFANTFGIGGAARMSNFAILWLIAQSVAVTGREYDLMRWYVFRIVESHDWATVPKAHLDDQAIVAIAVELLDQPNIVESARKEAKRSALSRFSSSRLDDSVASTGSAAYKAARSALLASGLIAPSVL